MTTRRGFFGILAGLAVCPLFGQKSLYAGPTEGHKYTFHYRNFICDDMVSSQNCVTPKTYDDYCKVFVCENKPTILYWSKEVA
jgi:hypothetical protein